MPNYTVTATTETPNVSTTEQVTTTAPFVETNDTAHYMSQLVGLCHDIPAGIHVDVLYTLAGKANWKPIYNVVSAKIRSESTLFCVWNRNTFTIGKFIVLL